MNDDLILTAAIAYFLLACAVYVGDWTFCRFQKNKLIAKSLMIAGIVTFGICCYIKYRR